MVSTRECCQGYSRFPHRHGPNAACVKVETVSFEEAAKKYGYPDFTATLQTANLTKNQVEKATLLLPLRMEMMEKNMDNSTMENDISDEDEMDQTLMADEILEYLIPNKTIDLEEIENESVVKTENGHTIRFNVYPKTGANATDYEYRYHYTAICVPVIKPQIFASQGMILGLEKKLPVAEVTLMEMIKTREDLSKFSQMMEKFNMSDLLAKQDALTILAPSDEAFANLTSIEERMLLSGDACAAEFVSNHILGLTLCSSAIVKNARAHVQNLHKGTVSFERDDEDQIVINRNAARAVETDLIATNGVLHVIDSPLASSAAMTVSSLLNKGNSSIFADLMLKSGYAEQFEDLRGVTFFVPSDRAMEGSKWTRALNEDEESLMKNASLYDFLANHVVGSVVGYPDFQTGFIISKANMSLKMNTHTGVSFH